MKKFVLPAIFFAAIAAGSARADGAWTKYPLSHQAPYPAALVGRPDNLARFAQTTLTVDGNTRTGWQDTAWRSSMTLVTNGIFDMVSSSTDEGYLYPMQTGSSAAFAFGAPARVDEVRVYSCWRDNGRCDVGVASVDVCDAQGNWTSLPGSELAFSDGGASLGWRLVFADSSGAPLADDVSGVRVVFGTMDNEWVGIAEIEVLGPSTPHASTSTAPARGPRRLSRRPRRCRRRTGTSRAWTRPFSPSSAEAPSGPRRLPTASSSHPPPPTTCTPEGVSSSFSARRSGSTASGSSRSGGTTGASTSA